MQSSLESVQDYPTPPKVERISRHLRVEFAGEIIADTRNGFRVLETNHPPVYFFPPDEVRREFLIPGAHRSKDEWLGEAFLLSLRIGKKHSEHAALVYAEPEPRYVVLRDCIAFYAARVDGCFVNGERVIPAPPGMAGWITRNLIVPYAGKKG